MKRSLCIHIGLLVLLSANSWGQNADSLLQVLPNTTGTERIDVLHELTIRTWLNYPEEAMRYVREAYELSEELDDMQRLAKSIRLIGGVYYYKADYDSTLLYSKMSLDLAIELNDTILINNALNNTGLAYYNVGSYQNALENLLRSLRLKKSIGEVYGLPLTLNNVGLVYNKLKDFEKARDYFSLGLEAAQENGDPNLVLYSQNNIAQTYIVQGELEKAKELFYKSLALNVDNKNWNAVAYSGLAEIHQREGNFQKGREFLAKAHELRKEIGDKQGISEIFYLYSKEAKMRGAYDSAILLLDESSTIARQIGSRDRMLENIELYVAIYRELGDLDKAFDYQSRLLSLRDTLFNQSMARNLAAIQLKIQEEETEELLSRKEQQLIENRRLTLFLIVVIVLVIAIMIIVLRSYRHNKKINKVLAERNQEIEEQKEEITQQKEILLEKNIELEKAHDLITQQNVKLEKFNLQLQDTVNERTQELQERNQELKLANLELDNFIYKSSHDIKGPLATLMGVCNVALMDIEDDKARQYFTMLAETSKGLNDILARLKTVSDINSLELKHTRIDFHKIIDRCIEQNRNIEGIETINIEYSIEEPVKYESDPFLMDLIFFNLIQNSIKFQKEHGESSVIRIELSMQDDHLIINMLDNGIGIKEEDADEIFQMFSKTAIQHHNLGLGLYIVKQCIQRLGGEIMLITDDLDYTHFRIALPTQ